MFAAHVQQEIGQWLALQGHARGRRQQIGSTAWRLNGHDAQRSGTEVCPGSCAAAGTDYLTLREELRQSVGKLLHLRLVGGVGHCQVRHDPLIPNYLTQTVQRFLPANNVFNPVSDPVAQAQYRLQIQPGPNAAARPIRPLLFRDSSVSRMPEESVHGIGASASSSTMSCPQWVPDSALGR